MNEEARTAFPEEALIRNLDRAFLVALRACGSPALAEDAVQETFVRLLNRPLPGRTPDAVSAYALTAVRRTALELVRQGRYRKKREEQHVVGLETPPVRPDAQAEREELTGAVRRALEALPTEEREAVSACCELGLSRERAAGLLEVPARTLSDRVQRGLEKLRLQLAAQGFAALSALSVSDLLCGLGVPKAPETLLASIKRICTEQRWPVSGKWAHSARRGATGRTGSAAQALVIACAAAGTAALAGWFFASRKEGPASAPSPSVAEPSPDAAVPPQFQKPELAAPVKEQPFYRRWTFEKGPPADIELRGSAWRWDGRRSMLAGAEGIALVFDLPHPQRPLWFEIKVRVLREEASFMGLDRSDGNGILAGRMWNSRGIRGGKAVEADYLGQLCSTKVLFKERHSLAYNSDNKLYAICEFATAPPSAKVALVLHLVSLEEIVMRTVAENELPAEALDPARTIQQLGWISKEIGYKPFLLQPADKR